METISEIFQKNFATNTPNEPEFCEVCGEAMTKIVKFQNSEFMARINCECERNRIAEQKEREKKQQKLLKIEKLKRLSLLGKRYASISFETTQTGLNTEFDRAFNRCKKYCEIYEKVIEKGLGIYIFGDKGVGKTHITACMANELIKKCVPVLFTSLFEISKAVKATFIRSSAETEQELFNKFEHTEFLFFDDLGTEIFYKKETDTWLQGLLFDLINKRYNANKPTVFSSNYSLNELINLRGVGEKTVDRIAEMTNSAVMKITGESRRGKQAVNGLF